MAKKNKKNRQQNDQDFGDMVQNAARKVKNAVMGGNNDRNQ